jgi:hypothetical protein
MIPEQVGAAEALAALARVVQGLRCGQAPSAGPLRSPRGYGLL